MIRLQRLIFAVLCLTVIGLLAQLSRHYPVSFDWTAGHRNSLSQASRKVLASLPGAIRITGFVAANQTLRGAMQQLIARYQRQRRDIHLQLINPQIHPALAEQYGVQRAGELVIDYRGSRQHVRRLSETAVSTALVRLSRGADRWIAVLDGYSNRHLSGGTRTDLDQLSTHLEAQGLKLRNLDLAAGTGIPDNISVLVIPPLNSPLPDRILKQISAYLRQGKNLLWFADPGSGGYLKSVADQLGVHIEPGMLVEPGSRVAGHPAPEFIQVRGYANHPVSAGLQGTCIFPTAASLSWQAVSGWRVRGIAASPLNSWRETGDLAAAVRFDEGRDSPGPADLAVALQRPAATDRTEQRVFVVGDTDFASNAYLGLGVNRAFASHIFNWLSADDSLIDLPVIRARDLNFHPDRLPKAIIVLGAPIVLPLALFGFGLYRWRRRRRL